MNSEQSALWDAHKICVWYTASMYLHSAKVQSTSGKIQRTLVQ